MSTKNKKNNQSNNCDCFRCREAKDRMQKIQRENFALSVFIGFGQ